MGKPIDLIPCRRVPNLNKISHLCRSNFWCDGVDRLWFIHSVVYLATGIPKFTGEDYLDRTRPKNTFDSLFFLNVARAVLVYPIAIPFFMLDYTSLPLSVGILTSLMWMPLSWLIDHWIGLFHALSRTVSVLALWYLFAEDRFVYIPAAIVVVWLISIVVLVKRRKVTEGNY